MRHVLSVLVENKSGVLSRVAGLISRRGFNIESLSVGPTEDPTMSRNKITDLTQTAALERELVLIKVHVTPDKRSEVIEIANIFRANIVDVGKTSLTIEITGSEDKLKGIEDLLRAYGIRTGLIAMSRGSKVS